MEQDKIITILYAFRNRDARRVRLSLQSLQQQTLQDFEVVFVDYGSEEAYASSVKEVVESFDFANYHYIAHPGLLWNKSKALNFGIRQARGAYVFIADVDVVFQNNFLNEVHKTKQPDSFCLFKIGYLPQNLSVSEYKPQDFFSYKPSHIHETFGVGLFPKKALIEAHGLDEFFHFYGSEDEDLNARLLQAGYSKKLVKGLFLHHLWHPRYPQKNKEKLTMSPRLSNVMRINQQHFLNQKAQKSIKPFNQKQWGICYTPSDRERLLNPDITLQLPNIDAVVAHFLRERLRQYTGKVVAVTFYEDTYYNSLKYRLKKWLGKQSQPYLSMKQVNDEILKTIVFDYRDCNYEFQVADNLKEISFIIAL